MSHFESSVRNMEQCYFTVHDYKIFVEVEIKVQDYVFILFLIANLHLPNYLILVIYYTNFDTHLYKKYTNIPTKQLSFRRKSAVHKMLSKTNEGCNGNRQ